MIRTSITIGGTRLADNDFSSVDIHQRVGGHHSFGIRIRQDANKGVLNDKAKSWIGKPVNIGFDYQDDLQLIVAPLKDSFKGIITSVGLSRQSGTAELIVNGQSPTIVADDGGNTRSFTDKGLQEIVNEVLNPYKGKFQSSPTIDPKIFTSSLPYTVQYKESNFSFIARLANSFGEWFYYDGLQLYFGKPAGGTTIVLDFGENSMSSFDISVRAVPAKFELRGYDYTKHTSPLKDESPQKAPTSALGKDVLGISTGQVFSQTPSLTMNMAMDEKEFKGIIKRKDQVNVDEIVILNGASRNPKLKIGSKIEVKDSAINENYGKFIITSLNHDIGQGGDYINHFEAIPEEVETPPLTSMPEPPFCEAQLAKVTDVNDDKGFGRVKVKFQWQEGSSEKTPWIRVASPYTGKDKGFYIIPEVDDQVLVAFENNHPDKPYVLTGMYNSDAKPEWFDAKNKYKGFKSKGGNKWKFDDEAKEIQMHAPNSILMTAGKTVTIRSGKKDDDSSITMSEGKEITMKTNGKSNSTITVDAGEGTVIIKAKTITIEATDLIELTSKKDVKMVGKSKVDIEGTTKVSVKSVEIKVDGSKSVDTSGAMVNIKGSAMVDVKGAIIKLN